MTLARAVDVSRRYGDRLALDRVSLDVAAGELVGLLGPNGAGKSTLVSLLTGVRRPTAGRVELAGGDPRDPAALALTYAKSQLIETVRIPIAIIGSAFWPAASMLAFVVPFTGDDPAAATYATASMAMFAVMSTNLFQYGIGVAEDRAHPWDPYVRTLPAGAVPRFAGRILAGLG